MSHGLAAFAQGREIANQRHGAYTWLNGRAPACRTCVFHRAKPCPDYRDDLEARCKPVEDLYDTTVQHILSQPQIEPTIDLPLAAEYARWFVTGALCDRWLQEVGLFRSVKGRLDSQPVMKLRATVTAKLLQIADALGLTPAARVRMRQAAEDAPGLAAARAVLQLEAERRQTVEAESTTEETTP